MKHFDKACPKPELVIGLAGPVGTDLDALCDEIDSCLTRYKYNSHVIKVSKLIEEWSDADLQKKISSAKTDERIKLLMNAGDGLREKHQRGDVLVPLVTSYIRKYRHDNLSSHGYKDSDLEKLELYNQCYIINSLKHPEEIRTLKDIYKDKFVLISAFRDKESRISNLCQMIAKSNHVTNNDSFRNNAIELIEIDAERPNTSLGQSLTKTFHRGDFFIRLDDDFSVDLERFFELFFGHPFVTPTRDEFFMFEAKSNSLRSADLSRQVGAVITNANNDIISRGCNEVPAVNGGAFWAGDHQSLDIRDYKQKRDFNDVKKLEILEEFVDFLIKNSIAIVRTDDGNTATPDQVVNSLVFGEFKESFRNLRVSNLIEFGRVVHAEMHALMEAARRGLSVHNGSLYCTTYPCHMCARHIIAAGIKRVIYVEPYPKSMTKELYGDSVAIDEKPHAQNVIGPKLPFEKVAFEPFEGIAPSIYKQLFSFKKRKDDQGYVIDWKKRGALPSLAHLSTAHLELELIHINALENISSIGLTDISSG